MVHLTESSSWQRASLIAPSGVETRFTWEGDDLVAQTTAGETTSFRSHAGVPLWERSSSGAMTVYGRDILGDIRRVTAPVLYLGSRRDPLTGLFNRGHFDEMLPYAFDHAQRTGHPLSLAIVDVEGGAQPPQMLAAGDVVMTTAYNGRITAANEKDKKNFKMVWKDSPWTMDSWVMATPNIDYISRYIRKCFASIPKNAHQKGQFVWLIHQK